MTKRELTIGRGYDSKTSERYGFINPPRAGVCVSDVPVMVSFMRLSGDLLDVDVGDSDTIKNISHQVSLPYDFVEETVIIKRIPDSTETQDDELVRLKGYSFDISSPNATTHCVLRTDEEGAVVSFEIEQQIGILSIQLVSKERQ